MTAGCVGSSGLRGKLTGQMCGDLPSDRKRVGSNSSVEVSPPRSSCVGPEVLRVVVARVDSSPVRCAVTGHLTASAWAVTAL